MMAIRASFLHERTEGPTGRDRLAGKNNLLPQAREVQN
jgi:hypothetical protein